MSHRPPAAKYSGHSSAKASHWLSGDQTTISCQRPDSRSLRSAQTRSSSVATSWMQSSVASEPSGRATAIEVPSGDSARRRLPGISMRRCSTSVTAGTASGSAAAALHGAVPAASTRDSVPSARRIRGGAVARDPARFDITLLFLRRHSILRAPVGGSRAGRPGGRLRRRLRALSPRPVARTWHSRRVPVRSARRARCRRLA